MLAEGMYIADRYEILEKIGTGGMSDVYKAMDHLLGRNVAVKVLKSEYSEDLNFLSKFRTEAQAAAGLEHPNIVNIYDVGSENKMHYIVMEYVEGITLKTYIEKKEKLSYKEAISIAIQTANGIRVAHNKQIVHRDIKPQNIIISTEGKVKVTDFGIARAATTNTISSDVMGSVHYASPEQARNGFVDAKSDIYSLGIVMYEMVTGRVPFHGDTAVTVALQHLQEEMILPSVFTPDLPISLEKIILKCTQKSPDRRYATVDDLIVDLKKALINPDEDFVVMDAVTPQGGTRIISEKEVEAINERAQEMEASNSSEEDEMFEEDDDNAILNPKMEKAVTIMGIVAAVFMVVVIILIIGTFADWFNFGRGGEKEPTNKENETNKVEVIDVTGMTFEEAKDALNKLNLGIKVVSTETSDDVESGLIISQEIEKGEMVEKNTTINVVVSLGEEVVENELPNVIGKTESEATALLQAEPYNLVVTVNYEFSSSVAAEKVMSVTPDVGNKVAAGSTVTITVSRGTEAVEVPSVVGKSETQAKSALTSSGFTVVVETAYSDSVEQGYVIKQSKEGGKSVAKGSSITITVSLGKSTRYYSFNYTVGAPGERADGYVLKSAVIKVFADGSSTALYETTVTSLPKTISLSRIENASKGRVVIEYLYVNPDDESQTKGESETINVEFTAQ